VHDDLVLPSSDVLELTMKRRRRDRRRRVYDASCHPIPSKESK
jgi:hypothetical protein